MAGLLRTDARPNNQPQETAGRPTPPRCRSVSLPDSVSLSPEFSPFSNSSPHFAKMVQDGKMSLLPSAVATHSNSMLNSTIATNTGAQQSSFCVVVPMYPHLKFFSHSTCCVPLSPQVWRSEWPRNFERRGRHSRQVPDANDLLYVAKHDFQTFAVQFLAR